MSGPPEAPPAAPPKVDPETLVLRGRPRPAIRFRRGLIVGGTGALAAALVAIAWLALQPPSFQPVAGLGSSDPEAGTDGADALADVPGSYGAVPRLGPPLPGDLGRPILEHQRAIGEAPMAADDPEAAAAEQARSAAEAERQAILAARSSPLLVGLAGLGPPPAADPEAKPPPVAGDGSPSAAIDGAEQDQFERSGAGDGDRDGGAVRAPSPWTLSAGTVIAASLVTGLNSDLPGLVVAQVTEDVRDSATGRTVLIPQGARLIGHYDSRIVYGQRRALLAWTRILLPGGSSVRLDSMPAADASGYAGLEDRVDTHPWQLLKGVALSTLLGVGTQLSLGGGGNELVRALRESAQQNAARAGEQITGRNLEVKPTLRVRPGWPVRLILSEDLVLQPWKE